VTPPPSSSLAGRLMRAAGGMTVGAVADAARVSADDVARVLNGESGVRQTAVDALDGWMRRRLDGEP